MSLACYFELPPLVGNEIGNAALIKTHADVYEPIVSCLIFKADSSEFLDRHDRDQKVVLVGVVQGADCPQADIPSVVHAYLVGKQKGQIGQGFLYQSICGMGSRIVPVFCHRERDLITPFPEYLDDGVIECGAQIVNRIPDGERNLGWRRIDGNHLDALMAGLSIRLDNETAEVCLEEGLKDRFHLLDVAIGPLNL